MAEYRPLPSHSNHVRNIAFDVVLSVITCFLYNAYWQYKQIQAVNDMIKQEKYKFSHWAVLCLVTCGLYHIYHEYRKSEDLTLLGLGGPNEAIISIVLTVSGLSIVADAIQQTHINKFYGNTSL